MINILLLVNQMGIERSALDFACYIADLTHSKLNGIFINSESRMLARAEQVLYGAEVNEHNRKEYSEPALNTGLAEHKKAFAEACSNKGINWLNNTSSLFNAAEIIAETRFADLLIMSAETTLDAFAETPPTALVREILSKAECPVIIPPLNFTGIGEVIFAYDGSESSMYAIKQFTYLFPQFSDERVIYLQVKGKEDNNITSQDKLGDFLKLHYSAVGYHVLHGKPGDELFTYLLGKKNTFVVIGAYGRSTVSTALRKSTAELILKTTNLPVFITHH